MSCPLPPFTPSQPLGCHRAPDLSSRHHTARFHWLSVLHMVIMHSMLLPQFILPRPSLLCARVHSLFSMSVFAALQAGSAVPSFYSAYI